MKEETGYELGMRVGIHTGSVLCGLIGLQKWQFDVWSNDVTIANAMESGGIPGYVEQVKVTVITSLSTSLFPFSLSSKVHISRATLDALGNTFYVEAADGWSRNDTLKAHNIETFFITSRATVMPQHTLLP